MASEPTIIDLARRAVEAERSGKDPIVAIGSPASLETAVLRLCGEVVRLADLPIPMRLICPRCTSLHIDEGKFATKPHHTHACQSCGEVWRPAVAATVGVRFLPGFKNEERTDG